ncbi:hypothetical protein GOEFS_106_01040 [Gordonia effusa NBRC 100432]|uniref:Uncharacterized protein n=1 Tax=Gordonia effusa NBRC 100432 TaxID=1077974 RepID=H0R555_9ACTN|nr:hypothetical protein GOEFS_106_01040 [Gordonia effusa NBRC 100432]
MTTIGSTPIIAEQNNPHHTWRTVNPAAIETAMFHTQGAEISLIQIASLFNRESPFTLSPKRATSLWPIAETGLDRLSGEEV